jgi:hypothetical protein
VKDKRFRAQDLGRRAHKFWLIELIKLIGCCELRKQTIINPNQSGAGDGSAAIVPTIGKRFK